MSKPDQGSMRAFDRKTPLIPTTKWIVFCCLVVMLVASACNKDDEKCKKLSVVNGDFPACRWMSSEADALCKSKGYELFWGKMGTTDSCDGSEITYITSLTCCP